MTRQLVVLLRGINVGPHKRIRMADLRALLEGLGYANVRTLLQSGNAVVRTGDAPGTVATAVKDAIDREFGFDVDVVVRTDHELDAVVAADPFGEQAHDPKRYVVLFLTREPDAAALRAVQEKDFLPEEFRSVGQELYVWCPDGLQSSPLNVALSHKRVAPVVTARNWNTVLKLQALVADGA
jgi:uncharacterized protein (DUF1697 family)